MSDPDEDFAAAVEPLVVELEALKAAMAEIRAGLVEIRREVELRVVAKALEASQAEQGASLKATLEKLHDGLDVLRARLDRTAPAELVAAIGERVEILARHRLDVPAWRLGVYRQGAVVQHFHGQYFEAVADTWLEPGDGVAWKRLGTHGFRFRGLKVEGVDYEEGDLIQHEGSMLLHTGGRETWLALRGRPGPRGAPGGPREGEGQP